MNRSLEKLWDSWRDWTPQEHQDYVLRERKKYFSKHTKMYDYGNNIKTNNKKMSDNRNKKKSFQEYTKKIDEIVGTDKSTIDKLLEMLDCAGEYNLKRHNINKTINDFLLIAPWDNLQVVLGKREFRKLFKWLDGQTTHPDGVYVSDLERYLEGLPVVD